MATKGTVKNQDKTQEIYLATAQIFFLKDYSETSLNDTADTLNITKAGPYYCFGRKQELLYRIITLGLDSVKFEVLDPARNISENK